MKRNNICFRLTNSESMKIELGESLDYVDCCYRARIFLLHEEVESLLSDDTLLYNMQRLCDVLRASLTNELLPHESINDDIGYLYNEYYQDESKFVETQFEGQSIWIGYKYNLWSAYTNKSRLVTWIYNDRDGNIILEVTPFYPYLYCDPEEESHYVSYEEWIKNYQPLIVRKISKKIAQEWLEQAETIIKRINANIERWKKVD
jgi:hypothetical protein